MRWRYFSTEDPTVPVPIWCWGTVIKVADGINDRVSDRKNAAVQKAGAVYIRWPADPDYNEKESFSWHVLLENKWNKNVIYGWR